MSDAATSLRLLSIDARHFGHDRAALSQAISASGADVVCVHGGPHLLRWRSITAAISRRAGLVVVTGGRTAGANVVLSSLSVDVVHVQDVLLGRGITAPGAALAALRLGGADFVVGSVTLIGNAGVRVGQAHELDAAIRRLVPGDPPVILSAEGADYPGTGAYQVLADGRLPVGERLFVDSRVQVSDSVADTQDGAAAGVTLTL